MVNQKWPTRVSWRLTHFMITPAKIGDLIAPKGVGGKYVIIRITAVKIIQHRGFHTLQHQRVLIVDVKSYVVK